MPLDPRVYLADIQKACQILTQFVSGRNLQDYETDVMLRSAVERQLTIAGEAVTQLLKVEPPLKASITGASDIIRFRNRVVHRYATLSNQTVWEIVQADVPVLLREVERLLRTV